MPKTEMILREERERAQYICRRISRDEKDSEEYIVHQLTTSGKHYNVLAHYNSELLLKSLESLAKRKTNGEFKMFRIKVDGDLLNGESKWFNDIGELIEALGLRQGVEARV